MKKEQLKDLISSYQNNTISDEDLDTLKQFVNNEESNLLLREVLDDLEHVYPLLNQDFIQSDFLFQNIISNPKIQAQIQPRSKKLYSKYWKWSSIAAACLLIFAIAGYYFHKDKATLENHQLASIAEKILPGGSKAKVVLEDGDIIDLESLNSDTTIQLDGYSIHKNSKGVLSYILDANQKKNKIVYNTIVTPKNGEYHLVLPDGTKIWINSSSELRYPLSFASESRQVDLTGEAYFEVKKVKKDNKSIPFIVNTGNQKLEVLGTTFNINNKVGDIKTTLVEGSVRLSYENGERYLLKPNQQAIYHPQKSKVSIVKVDPFYITSWKNGTFNFNNISIYEVMTILSDWYDLEVEYRNNLKDTYFTGTLSKYEQIDKVLQAIEMTGSTKFKMQGRRIIVMK